MYKKTINLKPKVEEILKKVSSARDDDNKLIANLWYHYLGENTIRELTAFQLLEKLSNSELPHSESIRRMRQKLQEENEELRGRNYQKRQKESETFRKNISQ